MRRFLLLGALFFVLVPAASAMRWLDGDVTPPVLADVPSSFSVEETGSVVLVGVPSSFSVEASSSGGAVVSYTPPTGTGGGVVTYTPPTATDDVDPSPTVGCTPSSGSTFPLGANIVTCTATDSSGNASAPSSFTITVVDSVDPQVDPSPAVGCTPSSGSTFPLGENTVICTATNSSGNTSAPGSFTITVTDSTDPVLSGLPSSFSVEATSSSGEVVTYTSPTATDAVDPAPTVGCTPVSGSTFALGANTVTCTATDNSGNTSEASFTITVADSVDPVLVGLPSSFSVDASSSSGAVATYTPPTATDNLDPAPTVGCTPSSGSTFPLGANTVTCTATDNGGNTSEASFTITVADSVDPVLVGLPSSFSVDASSSSGAVVTYTPPTATDDIDPAPTVGCTPSSGSTFPLGANTVTCTAMDSSGHNAVGSFTVTVNLVDQTAPVLHGVPSTLTREADGPLGSIVTYTPSATDNVDGPLPVTCLPVSGTKFPIGTTNVTCTATDSHDNKRTESFPLKVVDTTEPVLTVPDDLLVYATTDAGIPKTDPAAIAFLGGATATDIVDKTLTIGNDAPALFPVGATIVTFSTTDDSGNTAEGTAALVVFPLIADDGTPPPPLPGGGDVKDRTPPDNVKNLAAAPGSGKITLSWTKPSAADFDHITITRTLIDGTASAVVYTGKQTSYVDSSLQDGVEYRYTVVSFDASGNRSAGAVVAATPGRPLLLTPRDGARVKRTKTIRLSWARVRAADYYKVQLYFVTGLSANGIGPAKSQAETNVLTVWPKKSFFVLKKTWTYARTRRQLRPGVYHWYVRPGFGKRNAVNYGPLMGSSTFVVVR